ncbi:MAG: beta-lactamase family protein [Deltaproteobacteria bacterium]|nr:beta-lactamase family protein [Deltaproteobacteria bacterium]
MGLVCRISQQSVGLSLALALAIAGCGSDPGNADSVDAGNIDIDADPVAGDVDAGIDATVTDDEAWDEVRAYFDDHDVADMTLLIGDDTGTLLVHEKGGSTSNTEYRIASATKWVTAAVIMRLVEDGTLSLSDHPQDYLDYWTDDAEDVRSQVTLDQLLSFTSGFRGRPGWVPCVSDGDSTLAACAETVYGYLHDYDPGTTFHYGPAHMHTAARMAEVATGKSWQEIVVDELAAPLGFADDVSWALASEGHPMPSGGLRTSAAFYARFLQAVASGEILADSRENMATPRTVDATIGYTPIDANTLGAWTYALGQWRECSGTQWTAACDEREVSSSPGAFGFYPWYDRSNGYWAIIAVELALDQNPPQITVPLGLDLQPMIEAVFAARRQLH